MTAIIDFDNKEPSEVEIKKAIQEGFSEDNAVAKVCQDVILDAIISIPYYKALLKII